MRNDIVTAKKQRSNEYALLTKMQIKQQTNQKLNTLD